MLPSGPSFDRSFSVLVVDRQGDSSRTLDVLDGSNSHVNLARDFRSALGLIQACRPDVLITECRLLEYNGLHLVMRLRAVDPSAVAIVLTSFPDRVLQREAERLGAAYLTKPVVPSSLFRAIADGLTHRFAGTVCDLDRSAGMPRPRTLDRGWSSH